jgi:4-amino-4-deoxy-L-arabinose transferase-like glycosyltransferase
VLAALFGVISFRAVLTKSPTYDEPCHFGSAYAHTFLNDDRTDTENPFLWKSWAMLFIPRGALGPDPIGRELNVGVTPLVTRWYLDALFEGHWDRGMSLINRARIAMMTLGMILLLTTAWWAHRIAGPWAAVATAAMMTLDPACLAFAPLVKNDVPLALTMLAALIAMWRVGQRMTLPNSAALCVACAAAINVKFSAVLLPLIVFAALAVRAWIATPWPVFGRTIASRWARLGIVLGLMATIMVALYIGIWAGYGFRFTASPDPTAGFKDLVPLKGWVEHVLAYARQHRLLPEAFCTGFLRLHYEIHDSRNFLMGQISGRGWWYYYPFVFLVKMPLATLAAIGLAPVFLCARVTTEKIRRHLWTITCIALPTLIYLLSAMSSDYDHGIRSLLPIFPPVFVAVGAIFAHSLAVWPKLTKILASVLVVGLAVESLWAYPNYIAFFNAAAGGSRGGLALLGDSNLDWGQELNGLVEWHNEHPQTRIYLAYWGEIIPHSTGLWYVPMPGIWNGIPDILPNPNEPGVLVVSGSILQGIYVRDEWRPLYEQIRRWKPREVIGGSLYIYDFPSPEMQRQ